MVKSLFYLIVLILCCISLTSCSAIILGMYGIKNPHSLDEKEVARYSQKYKIPLADNYELDTSFSSFITSFDKIRYKAEIKNHYQPLQALYFERSGQVQSFHVNCHAGGFPNLKWRELNGAFPPAQQTPVDSLLLFDRQLACLRNLSSSQKIAFEEYDYVVVIYWSCWMGRQSKRFIRSVQQNCENTAGKKVKVIYVNSDKIYSFGCANK